MLRAELNGEPYSKADHNRNLQSLLDGRTKSSVEFKHQNISAVLVNIGLPYIDGYKPARNYQKTVLPFAIDDYLVRNPELLESLAVDRVLNPVTSRDVGEQPVENYSWRSGTGARNWVGLVDWAVIEWRSHWGRDWQFWEVDDVMATNCGSRPAAKSLGGPAIRREHRVDHASQDRDRGHQLPHREPRAGEFHA
jgi:hypothetical protein